MTGLEMPLAVFLLVNLLAALVRALRGPTAADRMLAALLFGTTGVGVLLLLAHGTTLLSLRDILPEGGGAPPADGRAGALAAGGGMALLDVALVLALLAAIAGVAFARQNKGGDDA